jgi:hypothetical protein
MTVRVFATTCVGEPDIPAGLTISETVAPGRDAPLVAPHPLRGRDLMPPAR